MAPRNINSVMRYPNLAPRYRRRHLYNSQCRYRFLVLTHSQWPFSVSGSLCNSCRSRSRSRSRCHSHPSLFFFFFFNFILGRIGKNKAQSSPHFHGFNFVSCVYLTRTYLPMQHQQSRQAAVATGAWAR